MTYAAHEFWININNSKSRDFFYFYARSVYSRAEYNRCMWSIH